ncbi:hypothetical protein Taro_030644, partial [Colocasia esculenta]|nr:hypothetical protein [Colocasia esculenta]
GQTREQPFSLLFLLFFSFSIFVRFHSFRWLTGARGKTLVREAELDRAENNGSGGGFREEASKGLAQIEVWQDFLHTSEALLFLPFRVSTRGLAGQDSGNRLVTGNADLGSLQQLSTPAPLAPTPPVPRVPAAGPQGPSFEDSGPSEAVKEVRPSGPVVEESGPSGPVVEESGPSGPVVEESGPSGSIAEEVVRPPGPSVEESGQSGSCEAEVVGAGPSGPVESEAEPAGFQALV